MLTMLTFLRQLLCRHRGQIRFVRNIYGDEIFHSGGKRSVWQCCRCEGIVAKQKLMLFDGVEPDGYVAQAKNIW